MLLGQYQGATSLYNKQAKQQVNIDPIALRSAVFKFKVSDGLIPSDKLISSDTMQTALQVFGSSPQIAAAYNIAPFFSYLMKTQGADIKEFEKSASQQAYEQAIGQWQQSVQALAANLKGIDPAAMQKMLSTALPQPKPADYGYNPSQPLASKPVETKSLLSQITDQMTAAAAPATPATNGATAPSY